MFTMFVNKKIVGLSMLALMGGNVLATVSTVSADETSQKSDTTVTYRSNNDIPDPDNPDNPEYVISTPGNITFTDDHKEYDRSVHMYKPDGKEDYDGDKKANISVKSSNGFQLKNVKDEKDTVSYKLIDLSKTPAVALTGTGENDLGQLSKTANDIKLRYQLTGQAKSAGVYQDTVTYTVSSATGK